MLPPGFEIDCASLEPFDKRERLGQDGLLHVHDVVAAARHGRREDQQSLR